MKQTTVKLSRKQAEAFEIPLGNVNLVFAKTDVGMIACGAIDVMALDRFDYPAARVKATRGPVIATVDDLLAGEVREANASAQRLGIQPGMPTRTALEKL
jgi:uncharacterized protein YunC (DUF1805 family)